MPTPPDARFSPSGLPVQPVYRPADAPGSYAESLGDPGEFPFTRGVQPTMYRGRLWTMRQYAGFGTAAETNARFRHLLAAGQTGLSVAFDLPTQMGIDSDAPRALGEVGRVGVAIDTVYSHLVHGLERADMMATLKVLTELGLPIFDPAVSSDALFDGLEEFRQHLGGRLTVTMLRGVGGCISVHEIDRKAMHQAIEFVQQYSEARTLS